MIHGPIIYRYYVLLTLTRSIEWYKKHSSLLTLTGGTSTYTDTYVLRKCLVSICRFAYEEKGVVVLKKEFPDSPYHWYEFPMCIHIKKTTVVYFSWMGRTIIERPLKEIAEFLKDPTSALIYDKHITVGLSLNPSHCLCMYPPTLHLLSLHSAIKTYPSSVSI